MMKRNRLSSSKQLMVIEFHYMILWSDCLQNEGESIEVVISKSDRIGTNFFVLSPIWSTMRNTNQT